jgi:vacuolar-type H+-ATPase subunit E/Vma4
MVTKSKTQKLSAAKNHAGRSLWNMAQKYLENVPKEELEKLEKLSKDGASNHDYYLYGSPKRK